ncbi:Zn-ribbon domain-containing OB-fold protein [Sphingomonas sp.]
MTGEAQTGPAAAWRKALGEGRLLLQRDPTSGDAIFPPRPMGEAAVEWIEASGLGHVYSATVVRPKPPESPYNVVLVDLAEGARMMARVEVAPDAVRIGMAVRARIVEEAGAPLIVFDPA